MFFLVSPTKGVPCSKRLKGYTLFVEVRGGSESGPGEDWSARVWKSAVGKTHTGSLKDPHICCMRLSLRGAY